MRTASVTFIFSDMLVKSERSEFESCYNLLGGLAASELVFGRRQRTKAQPTVCIPILPGVSKAQRLSVRQRMDDWQGKREVCDAVFGLGHRGFPLSSLVTRQEARDFPVHRPALNDFLVTIGEIKASAAEPRWTSDLVFLQAF
jgi:hypothetical protein